MHHDEKAARIAENKAKSSLACIDPSYTTPIDLDYIAARHKKEPSPMAFLVLNQGAIAKSMENEPPMMNLACSYRGCPDQTYHTWDRFLGCILDRGDTVDVARRLWFGKKQFNDRRTLAIARSISPVPLAHVIECGFPGCPYYGMHTLGRLVGCVTSDGGSVDAAIRLWNSHVARQERVPLAGIPDCIEPIGPDSLPVSRHIESARTNVGSAPPAVRHPCGQSRCHAGPSHSGVDPPIEENLEQKLSKSTDLVKDLRILMNGKRRSFRKEDEGLIERAIEMFRKLDAMPPALEDLSDTREIDETTDRMNLHSGNVYLDAVRAGFNVKAAIKYGWAGPGDGDSTENCGLGVLVACKDQDGPAKVKWVCHDCDNTGCMKCMHIPLENRARKQTLKDLSYMVLQRAHLVRRYDIMLQHVTASPPKWLRDKMVDPKVVQSAFDFAVEKVKYLGLVNATAYTHMFRYTNRARHSEFYPHFHFVAFMFTELAEYANKYRQNIAEYHRYQNLVSQGQAKAEPAKGLDRVRFREALAEKTGIMMMNPNPVSELNSTTGWVFKNIHHYNNLNKRVYLDNAASVERLHLYLSTHAYRRTRPGHDGHISRRVGYRDHFKVVNILSNSSDLIERQFKVFEEVFKAPDKKKYPDATLKCVTLTDVHTGRGSLGSVDFRALKKSKSVTYTGEDWDLKFNSVSCVPQDSVVYPAPEAVSKINVGAAEHQEPAKGPPDDGIEPDSWPKTHQELTLTGYLAEWKLYDGTKIFRKGVLVWDPSVSSLCPACGKGFHTAVYKDKIPVEHRYAGKTSKRCFDLDADKIQYETDEDYCVCWGRPFYKLMAVRPVYTYGCPVPNPFIEKMPLEQQFEWRARLEMWYAQFAVKWITHWEKEDRKFKGKEARSARKCELLPAALAYAKKYGVDIVPDATLSSHFLLSVMRLHHKMQRKADAPVDPNQSHINAQAA